VPGKRQVDKTNATKCTGCLRGRYTDVAGTNTTCSLCPTGYSQNKTGGAGCLPW
jgi:hypothetical protein